MKERPILFSAPMVQAILEGRKVMTRRVVNPQPVKSKEMYGYYMWKSKGYVLDGLIRSNFAKLCPYGQPGDRLWVRETFRLDAFIDGRPEYRATPTCEEKAEEYDPPARWKPSIFMNRKYSRILLEITAVRVERLNDISEKDAKAEGINEYEFYPDDGYPLSLGYTHEKEDKNKACVLYQTRAKAFKNLWESINGPGSWDANPWVWVVEFKVVGK